MAARDESRSTAGTGPDSAESQAIQERRVRAGLRALVDEMLAQIRSAASHEEAWSADERKRAEDDLARIMERVRAEALATRAGR